MSVLVVGGAGYIGSHTVLELIKRNEDVIVVDSLEKGYREAVLGGKFILGNILDKEFIRKIFKENEIEAVIHFAAYIEVGESAQDPIKYYNNNVVGTLNLLKAMQEAKVDKIIFSSSAAVYGEPVRKVILETDTTFPTSAYGESKLIVERMLKWIQKAYGINYVSLRYFNACGADESGEIGEAHTPESHLIPLVLQVALGKREKIKIFGNDYDTPDGTCIRDYIHVSDLAKAHILALEKLRTDNKSDIYNLGNGKGFSVKEVIKAVENVTGHSIKQQIDKRRDGDPSILVASSEKIKNELGWIPEYTELNKIIETAWKWHKNHINGYK